MFRSWAKGSFSLTILLGITWILGYLLLVDDPWVGTLAAYAFTITIFNASQVYQYSNHNVTKYVGAFNNLLFYSRFHRFSYLISKNYLRFLSQGIFLFIFNIVMDKGIRSKSVWSNTWLDFQFKLKIRINEPHCERVKYKELGFNCKAFTLNQYNYIWKS